MHLVIFREYLFGCLKPMMLEQQVDQTYSLLLIGGLRGHALQPIELMKNLRKQSEQGLIGLSADVVERIVSYNTLSYRNVEAAEGQWCLLPPHFSRRTEFFGLLFRASTCADFMLLSKQVRASKSRDIQATFLHLFFDELRAVIGYLASAPVAGREEGFEMATALLSVVSMGVQVAQWPQSAYVENRIDTRELVYIAFPQYESHLLRESAPEYLLHQFLVGFHVVEAGDAKDSLSEERKYSEKLAPKLYTNEEVAAILKVSKRTLENIRRGRKITFTKKGHMIYYTNEDIERYLGSAQ